MDLSRSEIEALASKMIDGSITASEQTRLNTWLNGQMVKGVVDLDPGFAENAEQLRARMLAYVLAQKDAENTQYKRNWMKRYVPYLAAAILVGISIGTWMFVGVDKRQPTTVVTNVPLRDSTDVLPGGNRATLTLADGQTINLSDAHTGIVVGDAIAYLDGSSVLNGRQNRSGNTFENSAARPLVLTTPKGGTYQITLPDGTRVWLNSASTLKYPSKFQGNERVVELQGEAYFDVARSLTTPFKVLCEGQIVEVLGTRFNVAGYGGEQYVKTTLVEGAVRVMSGADRRSSITLSPGQQSNVANGKITVNDVDTKPYVAWKSGLFYFKHTPFEEMMNQIERWYDVDVEYTGRIPQDTFSGRMSRNVSLMTVLDLLKVSEIHYRISGKKLIVE